MSKKEKKEKKVKVEPVKKKPRIQGPDRKHNRTVPQGIATKNSKWEALGGGFYQLKGRNGWDSAFVQKQHNGKMRSVTKAQVTAHLEELARVEAEAKRDAEPMAASLTSIVA